MKTLDVKLLVDEVMADLPKPLTEHVIEDVFVAIESRPEWRSTYDSLCESLTKTVVNNWVGRWIGVALDKVGEKQLPSRRSSLVDSYSLLDADASMVARKRTETEAREAMSKHFFANRSTLPEATVRARRDVIIKLLMQGLPPEGGLTCP
jgi:hypothetical protein